VGFFGVLFLFVVMVFSVLAPAGLNVFKCVIPFVWLYLACYLESGMCNRFIKPKSLNIKTFNQLRLRGPNVLFLANVAYGDGSTHINVRYEK